MKKLVTICLFVAITGLMTPSLASSANMDAPCGCGWPTPNGLCCD